MMRGYCLPGYIAVEVMTVLVVKMLVVKMLVVMQKLQVTMWVFIKSRILRCILFTISHGR